MLFLIIPLALLGAYLLFFCVLPEKYCFTQSSLEIRHKAKKTVVIPYESVFNYEATAKDSFINIFQSNRVRVYYETQKKKVAVCMPVDVATFVETLKWNCPEFFDDQQVKTKLESLFDTDK